MSEWRASQALTWLLTDPDNVPDGHGKLDRLQALVRAMLGANRADALLGTAPASARCAVPAEVVADFRAVAADDPYRRLAALYETLMDGPSRRLLGTFFTPPAEAAAVVELYAHRSPAPDHVVDVGAGVGVFTAAASAVWPDATIWAVDLNPATLALQAAAIELGETTDRIRLVEADYTRWMHSFNMSGPVLYLGNPPYTRWQLIPAADRDRLRAAGGAIGARANLSTLIMAMTLQRMRPQDGLAMILPASWMHASYGAALREQLLNGTDRSIEVRTADSWRFDGAVVDAAVVIARPAEAGTGSVTIAAWNGDDRRELRPEELGPDWRFTETVTAAQGRSLGLGEFATIRRGAATGANAFFLLRPEDVRRTQLQPAALTPAIRRLRPSSEGIEATECFLFTVPVSKQAMDAASAAYVTAGEVAHVHERVLCQRRRRWWDVSAELSFPDVVIGALGRTGFHIYPADGKTTITNNLFGLTWRASTTSAERTLIVRWLLSGVGQSALLRSAAPEANGLYRLSPRRLARLPVPIVRRSGNTSLNASFSAPMEALR